MKNVRGLQFWHGLMVIAGVLSLSSCTHTDVNPSPSGAGGAVQVLYTPPSGRPYTELGLVTTQSGQTIFHDRSTNGMIQKLQAQAAQMGADAIIVRSANAGLWGLQGGGNTGFDRGSAEAVAIKYK